MRARGAPDRWLSELHWQSRAQHPQATTLAAALTDGPRIDLLIARLIRYVELLEKDVLRFGYSSREFVILHTESAADD